MRLIIIIATYNESENIRPIISAIFKTTLPFFSGVEILVVDDNSPDGTAEIVKNTAIDYPGKLHLLIRENKQGNATAVLKGLSWGMAGNYEYLLTMDADFSHDPQYIPQMINAINNADIVIGSRNVKGGVIKNRTWVRNLITKCAPLYCRIVLRCPIYDITGGYNMYRKEALERIDIETIQCRGYSYQIEIKFKAYRAGLRLSEIPIIFPDRKLGASKMPKKYLIDALRDVWKIKKISGTDNGVDQFFKFAITGGLGSITNLGIFFLCADVLKLAPTPISIVCFIIAGTQNYLIHHRWTFSRSTAGEKPSLKKWLLFLCVSAGGLCINLLVLNTVLYFFILPYKFIAQAAGIIAGMAVNFFTSKLIVFRKRNKQGTPYDQRVR